MQEAEQIVIPVYKLYSVRSIRIATILGGPVAGGYIIAENFKNFGRKEKIEMTWIYSIIATLILSGTVLFIRGADKIPTFIIPLICVMTASYFAEKLQGDDIKYHIESGQIFPIWRSILVSLIACIVTIIYFVIIIIVFRGFIVYNT